MPIRDISNVPPPPSSNLQWRNWARTEEITTQLFRPRTIAEVVKVVVDAESLNRRVRAAGRRWSFDDSAKPDHISVDMSSIPGVVFPAEDFLAADWQSKLKSRSNSLVLALAGAYLWELNETLWDQECSMLTLGGNQGQTLAGAFSTGTHGSDLDVSGVADAIHAIHLVGSGGQEYWIEREDGVTNPAAMARNYPFRDEDNTIVQLRDDEVFSAALVSLGRFGIIFAVLLEVAPRYRLREWRAFSSWPNFVPRLITLRNTGDLKTLDEDDNLDAIQINLDPYGAGHGGNAALVRRWKVFNPQVPDVLVPPAKGPDALAREVGASIFIAERLSKVPLGNEAFAEIARGAFGEVQAEHAFVDRNYRVTSGVPTAGMTHGQYFDVFDVHGPFVVSMEYFFDGRTDDAIDFVNAAYNEWRGYLGGGFSVRFATKASALLGPQRFAATVIVEVIILQGFKDSEAVRQRVKSVASQRGAVPHWGQEHLLSPPEVQALYGNDASKWRRALARVTRVGNPDTFSTNHSRRLGLEVAPAVIFKRANRIRAWLDRRQGMFAFLFLDPGVPALPDTLTFRRGSQRGILIDPGGTVHAKRPIPGGPFPGSLVFRRSGQVIAEIRSDGSMTVAHQLRLPEWMRECENRCD